jgi:hypothetical protein
MKNSKTIDQAKKKIDKYIESMMWAKNKHSYSFMLGMVQIYNLFAPDNSKYTMIPDEPDVWTDVVQSRAAEQRDEAKESKLILPDTRIII